MEKLFLLDAYALIYRAYYAFIKNPRINSKGLNTSAILGFVNTLEEVLSKEQPTHIGIAFDPSGPTFRHEAFEQYKAQREETPEAIRTAVPIIKDIIRAYRIPILEVKGYEADDVIGTLARQADELGIETYMMTPDKDYGQLVTSHVRIYRPKYGDKEFEIMGIKEVTEKYGINSPLQVIDMLGLMGDASDNIPGCPGVGEKTAVKLIQQFGSIVLVKRLFFDIDKSTCIHNIGVQCHVTIDTNLTRSSGVHSNNAHHGGMICAHFQRERAILVHTRRTFQLHLSIILSLEDHIQLRVRINNVCS